MEAQNLGQMARMLGLSFDPYFAVALVGLIMARTLPMVVLSPIFGGKTVTGQIKVGIAVILMVTLYPMLAPAVEGKLPLRGLAYWGLIMKEAAVGGLIGFVSSIVFQAIESAGHLIDIQRGTAQASVLVPQLDIQGPVFANLHVQLGIVLFLILNLHHIFLRGYYESFLIIPVNLYPQLSKLSLPFIEELIKVTAGIFLVSVQLTAPILVALFMVDVVLGVANRIAPQVNVYFLGQPIKAAVGIVMFVVAFTFILRQIGVLFMNMLQDIKILLKFFALE